MYTRHSGVPSKGGSSKSSHSAKKSFSGRPSFGHSSRSASSTPSRGGYHSSSRGRGGFSSRGGRGGGRSRFAGERIDFAKFIRRAEPVADQVPYVAKHTFADFPFSAEIQKNITKKGFTNPMPIQDQTIPSVIARKDLFGLANTGTGKTAAFLLPLIDRGTHNKLIEVMILAPTRELATQIEDEFRDLAFGTGLFSVSCVGGMPIDRQIREIKRGVHFVIGTPGRVKDLIDRHVLKLGGYDTVVLDEADRMLDMGFRDDMKFILGKMPATRQTLFFSATMSPEIKKLTEEYLKNPEFVSVVTRDTSKNVDQNVIRAKGNDEKIEKLHEVLIKDGSDKVLIFREMKHSVDSLESELKKRGFKVGAIHGDKRNRERVRTLDQFKNNQINILIATDVAARGLDIPDVTHVINYDMPSTYDTYVHRIGRTGRGHKQGTALTFVPS